jgi:hypothetical protein
MARYAINSEDRAKSVPISLKPDDIKMLEELEAFLKQSKSYIVRDLIKKRFDELKKK